MLFNRTHAMPPALRVLGLALALLSGSVVGTLAVLYVYPLFVFRDPRQAAAIVVINGVLALIVGNVVYTYERMRGRLQDSLREVELVRLAEAQLREQAARAELAALQARIHPHFFFNTLNTISFLLDEDAEAAEEVVQRLADLFRYTLKVSDTEAVPLAEELEFVRGYLTIEQARFEERLRVEWDIDPGTLSVRVPGLIVQPLVENAVGHGISPRASGGTVRVRAVRDGSRLVLEVQDNGVGVSRAAGNVFRDGHGLHNTRQRLATRFRGQASLEVGPGPDGQGTVARILLPWTETGASSTSPREARE
jgi:two-component system LytT family sensor kinase